MAALLSVRCQSPLLAPSASARAAEQRRRPHQDRHQRRLRPARRATPSRPCWDAGIKLDQLILVTRTPEKLSSFAANGAEVRAGDFTKPETLDRAFAGGRDAAPDQHQRWRSRGPALGRHLRGPQGGHPAHRLHLVHQSDRQTIPSAVARDHRLTEEALDRSGVPYTVLRNQLYMDGLIEEAAKAIVTGDLYTNAGRGKWAPVTRRDCAEVAAVVLTTSGHAGKSYDITGPDLINRQDFAKLITEVTGKRVRVIDVDDSTFIQRAVQAGQPEAAAKVTASFGTAMRVNSLNIKAEVAQILMGRKPESLRELLTRNKTRLVATTTR